MNQVAEGHGHPLVTINTTITYSKRRLVTDNEAAPEAARIVIRPVIQPYG